MPDSLLTMITHEAMHTSDLPVLAVFGYLIAWLRGFPWFNNGELLVVALLAGTVATLLNHDSHTIQALAQGAILHSLPVLAGNGLGWLASLVPGPVRLAPKNNEFASAAEGK